MIYLFGNIANTIHYFHKKFHNSCFTQALKRDKVFKNGPRKICGRQPLKILTGYGPLKQTIFFQIF